MKRRQDSRARYSRAAESGDAKPRSRCSGCGSRCGMGQMDGVKKYRELQQGPRADARCAARARTRSGEGAEASEAGCEEGEEGQVNDG